MLHPALPDCPGHEFWRRDFTGATGLFSIVFNGGDDGGRGPLRRGGSSCSASATAGAALRASPSRTRRSAPPAASDWEGPIVRLHIGLEHPDDLIEDLAAGLAALRLSDQRRAFRRAWRGSRRRAGPRRRAAAARRPRAAPRPRSPSRPRFPPPARRSGADDRRRPVMAGADPRRSSSPRRRPRPRAPPAARPAPAPRAAARFCCRDRPPAPGRREAADGSSRAEIKRPALRKR